MLKISRKILDTRAPGATLLIRLSVGAVFLSEGIQKFLYPADLGAGRFARIGIPWPELMGPFVAVVEAGCGALVLAGLFTRLAAAPLMAVMVVALVSTKLPILLGEDVLGFHVRKLSRYGFWSMAHEARTDWAMLLGALFLLIVGAGRWSLDARLARRRGGAS
ncbi:DoxX family protein [Sorangium cellulosum]|uniref:DoxX family protein n=1 Tax=Sorangium cellulosum TaxID=56 RepID=A0A150PD43_SORCE|nr:DoxX family protein [Sorangium cellulosum]